VKVMLCCVPVTVRTTGTRPKWKSTAKLRQ